MVGVGGLQDELAEDSCVRCNFLAGGSSFGASGILASLVSDCTAAVAGVIGPFTCTFLIFFLSGCSCAAPCALLGGFSTDRFFAVANAVDIFPDADSVDVSF